MIQHNDRTPTMPGRRLITPEGGASPFYALVDWADQPTDEGALVNKAMLDEFLAASGITTGSATALSLAQPGFILKDGAVVRFRLHTAIASTVTLNVQNTGARGVVTVNGSTGIYWAANVWVSCTYSSVLDKFITTTGQYAHVHDTSEITTGRFIGARLPTSGTANRVLLVGATANSDPVYGQVNMTNMITGVTPVGNGGTNRTALAGGSGTLISDLFGVAVSTGAGFAMIGSGFANNGYMNATAARAYLALRNGALCEFDTGTYSLAAGTANTAYSLALNFNKTFPAAPQVWFMQHTTSPRFLFFGKGASNTTTLNAYFNASANYSAVTIQWFAMYVA